MRPFPALSIHQQPPILNGNDGTVDGVVAVPKLDLSFLSGSMPAGVTFARSTIATYFNTDGVLATAAINEPRFDCDPLTGARRGLLMEGSRTNLLLRSEEFDNASWVKTRCSVAANSTTAPDATVSADTIVEDNTPASTHPFAQSQAKAASALPYAVSLWVKPKERTRFVLELYSATGGASALVNASTAAVIGTPGGNGAAPYTLVSVALVVCLNGWVRVTLRATSNTDATIGVRVHLDNGTGAAAASLVYDGDGTSGIYVWGAQLEQATFESSYIKTTTAAVTRAYDQCTVAMAGVNSPALSMYFEGDVSTAQSASTRYQVHLSDGSLNNDVNLYVSAATLSPRGLTRVASVANGNPAEAGTVSVDAIFRSAYSTRLDNHYFALNGTASSDVTGAANSVALTILAVGGRGDSPSQNKLFGHARRVILWNVALPSATLQYLTR